MIRFIFALLLLPSLCFGDAALIGLLVSQSTSGQVDVLSTVTFETDQSFSDASSGDVDLYNGGAGEQGWVPTAASAWYLTDDQKKNGTQSLKLASAATPNIIKTYSEQSGEHWIDFWYALGADGDEGARVYIYDDATLAVLIAIWDNTNNRIRYFDGADWQTFCTTCLTVDNTFYHIQLLIKPSSNTFDGYLDGVKKVTGGAFNVDATAPDRIRFDGSGGILTYIDDVQVYTGSRK